MIILDHNIPENQAQQLRLWKIHFRQIGFEVGRPEWDDQQEILRYLHTMSTLVENLVESEPTTLSLTLTTSITYSLLSTKDATPNLSAVSGVKWFRLPVLRLFFIEVSLTALA